MNLDPSINLYMPALYYALFMAVNFYFLKVCPTFGTPLIRRILDNFVPDEFCPDPIPNIVLEALDSEVSQLHLVCFPFSTFS